MSPGDERAGCNEKMQTQADNPCRVLIAAVFAPP